MSTYENIDALQKEYRECNSRDRQDVILGELRELMSKAYEVRDMGRGQIDVEIDSNFVATIGGGEMKKEEVIA